MIFNLFNNRLQLFLFFVCMIISSNLTDEYINIYYSLMIQYDYDFTMYCSQDLGSDNKRHVVVDIDFLILKELDEIFLTDFNDVVNYSVTYNAKKGSYFIVDDKDR